MDSDDFDKLIQELVEYVSYEGTEIGEYWDSLVNLEREMDHMSDLFK